MDWQGSQYHEAFRVIAFPFENDPVSLISLEEAPTKTVKIPEGMTQACCTTSQIATSRFRKVTWKLALCPLLIGFLLNPLRTLGGSRALAGNPRYTCETSLPSNGPLLCTLNETVRAVSKRTGFPPIPPVGVTAGPVNEAVVFPESVALAEIAAEELSLTDTLPETKEAVTELVMDGEPDEEETVECGVVVVVVECETLELVFEELVACAGVGAAFSSSRLRCPKLPARLTERPEYMNPE